MTESPNGNKTRLWNQAARWAFLLPLALYIAQRGWYSVSGRCVLDSDEAINGIMALAMLRGHFTPFFLGQDYLGAFQALASLVPIVLLGTNPLAFRVTAIIEGLVILLAWRWMFRKWNMAATWWFFAILFIFSSDYITFFSLKSRGTIELLTIGSLWMVVFTAFFFSGHPEKNPLRRWFILGLATGIAWWTTQQVVYFLTPAFLWIVIDPGFRRRLSVVPGDPMPHSRRRAALAWGLVAIYGATLILLFARGTIYYQSAVSAWLFRYRWALVAIHVVAALGFAVAARSRAVSLWPLAWGCGTIVGYLPALAVFLRESTLYNTFILQRASSLPVDLETFFIITGGSTIGLVKQNLDPVGLPWILSAAVVIVYFTAIFLLYLSAFCRSASRRPPAPGEIFLAIAVPTSILIFCLTQRFEGVWPRYALAMVFYVLLVLGWFLASLWRMNRGIAAAVALLILGVNVNSTARHPTTWVLLPTLEQPAHIAITQFLESKAIHAASIGYGDSTSGYWFAYSLSFCSGERITVHPSGHMPRVPRYRTALEKAKHIAIITEFPADTERVFHRLRLTWKRRNFGKLTVLYDFDKKPVEATGLFDPFNRIHGPELK